MAMMMNMMMGTGRGGDYDGYHGGMAMGPEMVTAPDMMMGSGKMMGDMHSGMMMMATAGSDTGSAVVNIGWQSGNTASITLEGDRSARDASDICVMVFPHLT